MADTQQARIHGSPGEGARLAGIARALWPLLAALFGAGYVAGMASDVRLAGWRAGVILLAVGVALLAGTLVGYKRIAAFFKGAAGEEAVARVLANLPAGFEVFHSLDLGGGLLMWRRGDLDHLVIGPTGIFAIETKNWQGCVTLEQGALRVDGVLPRRPPVRQAHQAVAALQLRLGRAGIFHLPVIPVVCFANDRLAGGTQTVDDVVVCNRAALRALLIAPATRIPCAADVTRLVGVLTAV
jgi:hypothetical protein